MQVLHDVGGRIVRRVPLQSLQVLGFLRFGALQLPLKMEPIESKEESGEGPDLLQLLEVFL